MSSGLVEVAIEFAWSVHFCNSLSNPIVVLLAKGLALLVLRLFGRTIGLGSNCFGGIVLARFSALELHPQAGMSWSVLKASKSNEDERGYSALLLGIWKPFITPASKPSTTASNPLTYIKKMKKEKGFQFVEKFSEDRRKKRRDGVELRVIPKYGLMAFRVQNLKESGRSFTETSHVSRERNEF
ncbi:hypothetical protein M569_14861 [Genlisea aurea]|uniref:Uncharacterized protein n=1 Tax=Genlisea aurea TaxID=192259 RepID=S8BZX6_9LAMI|nr:hypothetical protein M569_14861 [Genlisea aurea]